MRLTTRLLALSAAAVLSAPVLAACGGSDGPTVTIGIGGNIFDLPIRVADKEGYFAKQGLTVKYVNLTASTGSSALDSGSVQFLNTSPTDFLSARGQGLKHLAIAHDGGGNPLGLVVSKPFATAHHLTAKSDPGTVAKALAHSTAGASSANTKAEAGLYLKAYGVDPGTLKWVSLPSPAADKASLKKNEIDWFVTSEPIPLQIQNSGDGVVVADPLTVPQWSYEQAGYGQLLTVKKSYATQNPETTRKVATAIQQATRYMHGHLHSDPVLSAARTSLQGVPDPVIEGSLDQVEWPANDAMSGAGWAKTIRFINSLGALPKKVSVTKDDWTNKYVQ